MGIVGHFCNFDQDFANLDHKVRIINDASTFSANDRESLARQLHILQDTRALSTAPECDPACGKLKSAMNWGKVCQHCGSQVLFPYERSLDPIAWMRAPRGIDSFIQPNLLLMLRNTFSSKAYKFDFIEWYINPHYQYSVKPNELALLESWIAAAPHKRKRGWNGFTRNFNELFEFLSNMKCFASKDAMILGIKLILEKYPECMFPRHIPLLNRSLVAVDQNEMGRFSDDTAIMMTEAATFIMGIDNELFQTPQHLIEARTAKAMLRLSTYANMVYGGIVTLKSGLYRRQLFGTRSHWAARGVIVSITDPHDYEGLHLPWRCGVGMLQLHLINLMLKPTRSGKPRFTYSQIWNKLSEASLNYESTIDEMFHELIGDVSHRRAPLFFQRNPSLYPVSEQLLYITKIKTDPTDPTFSFSIMDVRGPNADFDGDQMNAALWLDRVTGRAAIALAPYRSAVNLVGQREMNNYAAMPKPVVFNIANWLADDFKNLPVPQGPNPLDELQEYSESDLERSFRL